MPYKQITGIYQIKNLINNKVYIGSAKSIMNRFSVHKRLLKNNEHFNNHLQASYNKYGLNAFSFEILEVVEFKKELMEEREEFNILFFKSNNKEFGYNKRLKCNTNIGRKFSDEIKEKFRLSHIGNKQSKESIEKIRETLYKKVYKLRKDGKILCEYKSVMEAADENNLHRQNVAACCRNVLNSTGGFYWSFVDSYDENKKFKKINKSKKHVNHIYENIETGEKLNRLVDVSNLTSIDTATLYQMFTGKIKNKTKFIRYEHE